MPPKFQDLFLPDTDELFSKAKRATTESITQKIKYPCGCEAIGLAPMPMDCPTHKAANVDNAKNKPNQEYLDTLIAVVLDESGSMGSHKTQTISAYNEYVAGMRLNSKGNVYLTLAKFDTKIPTCRVEYKNKPLAEVPELTSANYTPGGGTPLYDAVGFTVKELEPEVNGRNVLVIILTDGEENSSREYTSSQVKAMIAEKEKLGWVFVYLGANQDAWNAGTKMGVAGGNTASYGMNNIQTVAQNLARSASNYSAMGATTRDLASQSLFASTGIDNIESPFEGAAGGTNTMPSTASSLGSLGGQARSAGMTQDERSDLAKKAANARWSKKILGRNKRANKTEVK